MIRLCIAIWVYLNFGLIVFGADVLWSEITIEPIKRIWFIIICANAIITLIIVKALNIRCD